MIPIFQHAMEEESSSLVCKAVSLGGNFPDYVSEKLRQTLNKEEAVIGLYFIQNQNRFFYAPALPGHGENWKRCISESDLALLDGTFWSDDELVRIHGSGKTARNMGHLPLSGAGGLLENLHFKGNARRVLIHLNNTNPALDPESSAHRSVREAGCEIAHDGMEFEL
jgi:pyrroloquinoline quinone biosynthesis protein B